MSLQEDTQPASLRSDPADVAGSDGGHSNKKPTASLTRIESVGDAQPKNEFSVMGYKPQLKRVSGFSID